MNRDEALQFLDDPKRYGSDTDPALLRASLKRLGSPESGCTMIHLAGTNGKGSTGAYLCSLLEASGETAGHFTSPHVLDFLERIRIGGENCDPETFARAAAFVKERLQDMDRFEELRAFSLQLFTALVAFRNAGVRFAVIEAGIGGRDDATNVLIPRVSVLTPVGLDHIPRLGTSLEEIARHKAGIMKPGVPVFSARQEPVVETIFTAAARVCGARLTYLPKTAVELVSSDPSGVRFRWDHTHLLHTRMGGAYQAENAGLAILVAEHLIGPLPEDTLRQGILSARMPGRRQLVCDDPPVVVDGAHNRHAIAALCREKKTDRHRIGIIGMMQDKETEEVVGLWKNCFDTLYLVPVEDERSWDPLRVSEQYLSDHPDCHVFSSLEEALAEGLRHKDALLLIAGSLYLAGEALNYFRTTA